MNSPLITVPTTLPRSLSLANDAEKATRICPTTEVAPMTTAATYSSPRLGATAAPTRPSAVTRASTTTSRRLSSRSPRGRRRSRPAA